MSGDSIKQADAVFQALTGATGDPERDRIDKAVMEIFIRYGERVDWDIVCEITSLVQRESGKEAI